MFFKTLDEVTKQTNKDCQSENLNDYLIYAIRIWCEKLNRTEDIFRGTEQDKIKRLATYIYTEWKPKQEEERNLFLQVVKVRKKSRLSDLVLNLINVGWNENVKFIVLIAFGITAVAYCVYLLDQQKKKQINRREEPRQYNANPPSFTVQSPPEQTITKQVLVLVVSASQADFIESMKAKNRINVSDGEVLHEITKYLWLDSKNNFNKKTANINQYKVSKGEESEYDIYLVYIKLNQADKGFEPNVNQLDRYDAFRKLADLGVELEVSPRLQMEAYEDIDVYSR